ncbi:hypothetical protein ACO2I3_13920 [Leptospira interrogans]
MGANNKSLTFGDRVVVPFTISSGECFFCQRGHYSASSAPIRILQRLPSSGGTRRRALRIAGRLFRRTGEYLRVLFADVGPIKDPLHLSDNQVLFLSDIFPTGYMATEYCDIQQEVPLDSLRKPAKSGWANSPLPAAMASGGGAAAGWVDAGDAALYQRAKNPVEFVVSMISGSSCVAADAISQV